MRKPKRRGKNVICPVEVWNRLVIEVQSASEFRDVVRNVVDSDRTATEILSRMISIPESMMFADKLEESAKEM
jgi:hypothetical protein